MENIKYGTTIATSSVCSDKSRCSNNLKLDKNRYCYSLDLTRKFLLFMNDTVEKIKSVEHIEIVNANLPRGILPIKENANRVSDRLRKHVSDTFTQFKRTRSGTKRKLFFEKTVHMHLYESEVYTGEELNERENEIYHRTIASLYNELKTVQERLNKQVLTEVQLNDDLQYFKETNAKLNAYIKEHILPFVNKGKPLDQCKRSQKMNKVSILKSRVEKALWFAKSFGVKIESVRFSDMAGKSYELGKGLNKPVHYEDMEESDKDKIKSILYILDSFGISDDAYHELSVANDSMVRSYLIKECRDSLNEMCTISQTPGDSPGAQVCLKESLDKLLCETIPVSESDESNPPKAQVKFAADGAKVSRLSTFLVLSVAVLNAGEEVMSASGQHTLAIVSADESYISIKDSFNNIFDDINDIIKTKRNDKIIYTTSSGRQFDLELFLGGDMKFLLLALGLNAANSKYACLYCKIAKEDRYDMTKDEMYYWGQSMVRSIVDMKKLSTRKFNYGCVRLPLLDIPIDHVIVDELHLLMRIGDVLIRNLIENSVNQDQKSSISTKSKASLKRTELVNCIQNCGVNFCIWETKVKDGRGDFLKNLEWTSLTGSDFKKLLKFLPEQLANSTILDTSNKTKVIELWVAFGKLYSTLSEWNPPLDKIDFFFEESKKWINEFLDLGRSLEGYDSKCITPYMHILVYHVPQLMKMYGGIKQFTGQGVEKTNDDIKLIYHRKTNKHAATSEALRVRYRKYLNRKCSRIKRKYNKKNQVYWVGGGKRHVFLRYKAKLKH